MGQKEHMCDMDNVNKIRKMDNTSNQSSPFLGPNILGPSPFKLQCLP